MRATPALGRCAVLTALLIAFGLSLRRFDLVLLATPFVIAPLMARSRTGETPRATLRLSAAETNEDEIVEGAISIASVHALDVVTVSLETTGFDAVRGMLEWVTSVPANGQAVIPFEIRAARWGRHFAGPAVVVARGPYGLVAPPAITTSSLVVHVLPRTESFNAQSIVPHALAYAGSHRSSAVGPGVEFAVVRPFALGDRLRRINWRATLRSDQLHVTTTLTERSAAVIVVIDSAHDAGSTGSSILDVSVHAAISITEHYLSIGDLVGLEEHGERQRRLGPGAGHRHANRARAWLMDVRPPLGERTTLADPWLSGMGVSEGLVIVLTPLLDEHAVFELARLRARGFAVVAVDTLPVDARPEMEDALEHIAYRLWAIEREMHLARLGEIGVPVVGWTGTRSLDAVLVDIARMAAAPRVVAR